MQQTRKLRAECSATSQRIAGWEAEAFALLAKVGRPLPGSGVELVRAIEQIQEDCDEAKGQVAARESAQRQLAEAEQKLAEARAQIKEKRTPQGGSSTRAVCKQRRSCWTGWTCSRNGASCAHR